MSSPRMRGCFRGCRHILIDNLVFPAHAGVFPSVCPVSESKLRLPRACGGVSGKGVCGKAGDFVFPAHAGVFLQHRVRCKPRHHVFPAHAGVFPTGREITQSVRVFPAHAGVFPKPQKKSPIQSWLGLSCLCTPTPKQSGIPHNPFTLKRISARREATTFPVLTTLRRILFLELKEMSRTELMR